MSRASKCHPDRKHYARGLCKPCYKVEWESQPLQRSKRKAYNRNYHAEQTKGLTPEQRRDRTLRARYGISLRTFRKMFLTQKGFCKLCDRQAKVVDHSHETGVIRGLLCPGCNSALNRVEEPGWVARALNYLKDAKG